MQQLHAHAMLLCSLWISHMKLWSTTYERRQPTATGPLSALTMHASQKESKQNSHSMISPQKWQWVTIQSNPLYFVNILHQIIQPSLWKDIIGASKFLQLKLKFKHNVIHGFYTPTYRQENDNRVWNGMWLLPKSHLR